MDYEKKYNEALEKARKIKAMYAAGKSSAYEEFISLLDTLEEPVSDDLEEAARHSEILTYPMPEDGDIDKVMKVQEARIFHEIGFKAGAKWQAERRPAECGEETTNN